MALTYAQEMRRYVGKSISDDELADTLGLFDDDPLAASLYILEGRLADFALIPGELSVDQDYQRKITLQQIALLERRIEATKAVTDEEEPGGLPQVGVGRLTRSCPSR